MPDQLRNWLAADTANAALLVAVDGELPAAMAALAAHDRVQTATFPACTIADILAIYESLGERLSASDEASRAVRELSTALGRISGSTLGRPRPAVIVAESRDTAYAGIGLVGDVVEIAGGEHVLEHAGPPCSALGASPWNVHAPEILVDAREPGTAGELAFRSGERPRVEPLPQLGAQLESLELVEAAIAVRALLFSDY
ncbi:MAG: hypothetical protein AAFN78_07965 [Pseudomonadota bacterium]